MTTKKKRPQTFAEWKRDMEERRKLPIAERRKRIEDRENELHEEAVKKIKRQMKERREKDKGLN